MEYSGSEKQGVVNRLCLGMSPSTKDKHLPQPLGEMLFIVMKNEGEAT